MPLDGGCIVVATLRVNCPVSSCRVVTVGKIFERKQLLALRQLWFYEQQTTPFIQSKDNPVFCVASALAVARSNPIRDHNADRSPTLSPPCLWIGEGARERSRILRRACSQPRNGASLPGGCA